MSDPEERMKHQKRRVRNFVAKALHENPKFKPKVIPDKRSTSEGSKRKRQTHIDDDGDYKDLDRWLKRGFDYDQEAD